ncbi:LysR family transcriptional regulator [Tianweitania sediminis]|uniref:LysR family transcriptional regulator n=1 Tax=Tianweitania sediminis TaxID=1502156 RepID=A0A8J7UIU2_9HYPH|nr:LysR family transcriptional regulator [Tianweitania sediminis]
MAALDIDRAKTFLEIIHSGNFLKAADRLHVTQTTVSARIRTLEEELGRKLFERRREGAVLTPAGREFERFAQSFVQVWERARLQLRMPPGRTSIVAIGGELSLWNPLLLDWLVWMKENRPATAIHVKVGLPDQLVEQLRTGVLDLAVLYAPKLVPGFKVELIKEEELVLVTSEPQDEDATNYVHVDWGPQLSVDHVLGSGGTSEPGLLVGLAPLGLSYILRVGGTGYFRMGAVRPHLEEGRLRLVPDAPKFTYPAYAVYSEATDARAEVQEALTGLKAIAR